MLFKRYINSLDSAQSFKLVINSTLISLCLSACSATPELEKNNSDRPEKTSLEKKEVALVPAGEVVSKRVKQEQRVPAKNLYLQQQLDSPVIITEAVQKDYQQALILMKESKWQQVHPVTLSTPPQTRRVFSPDLVDRDLVTR